MGKGDIKTKRGKISAGSYGVTRKRKKATIVIKPKAKKVVKKVKKEEAPKKETVAKKTTTKKATTKKAPVKKPAVKKAAAKK